jgi:hypothetical protein
MSTPLKPRRQKRREEIVRLEVNRWQVAAITASIADARPNVRHEEVVARMKARFG